MTGQNILDRMELSNFELQLQAGEADVARGLTALNVSQDMFEAAAAKRKGILGSDITTVTTTLNTESTAYPAGLLRIDRLHFIDATTSRPSRELYNLQRTGGHATTSFWPAFLISTTTTGQPSAYWTDGSNIYWQPLPDGTHTIRVYGFSVASDITAAGTFAYPDIVSLPLAFFAVRLMKSGIDDDASDLQTLATESFEEVLNTLASFDRDRAKGFEYTQVHRA